LQRVKINIMFKGNNAKENGDQPNRLNRLVEGTNIKGDIVFESNIRLDGELIGDLTTTGKLVLGATGKITGNIICLNADIEGKINGTIKVDGLLLLKATSLINGNITTNKIGIEKGAEFNGNCTMNGQSTQNIQSKLPISSEDSDVVY